MKEQGRGGEARRARRPAGMDCAFNFHAARIPADATVATKSTSRHHSAGQGWARANN